jgi:hypothetical protein
LPPGRLPRTPRMTTSRTPQRPTLPASGSPCGSLRLRALTIASCLSPLRPVVEVTKYHIFEWTEGSYSEAVGEDRRHRRFIDARLAVARRLVRADEITTRLPTSRNLTARQVRLEAERTSETRAVEPHRTSRDSVAALRNPVLCPPELRGLGSGSVLPWPLYHETRSFLSVEVSRHPAHALAAQPPPSRASLVHLRWLDRIAKIIRLSRAPARGFDAVRPRSFL